MGSTRFCSGRQFQALVALVGATLLGALLAGCSEANPAEGGDAFAVLHSVRASEADPKETLKELIGDSDVVVYGTISSVSVEYGKITQPAGAEAPSFKLQERIVRFTVEPASGGKTVTVRFWSQIAPDLVGSDEALFEKGLSLPKDLMLFALQTDPGTDEYFCTSLDSSLCPLILVDGDWESPREPRAQLFMEPEVRNEPALQQVERFARAQEVEFIA